ncbi:MAG: S8 family serine peptidase [Actinomycetota bacterium]
MENEKKPSAEAKSVFPEDRFAFRTDLAGNRIVVRPHQLLINLAPRADGADASQALRIAARNVVAEIVGAPADTVTDSGIADVVRAVRGDWHLIEIASDVEIVVGERPHRYAIDAMRFMRGLRDQGFRVQPNHVYFVDTRTKTMAGSVNPNFFAPNFFAPNFFAPNFFAPNFFAPNFFAAGGGGAGDGCCCPEGLSEGDEREIPPLAARAVAGPRPATAAAMATNPQLEIFVVDVATPHNTRGDVDTDLVDSDQDRWVDPATGHGDFVAYIIEHECGVVPTLVGQAGSLGDIDDAELVTALRSFSETSKGVRVDGTDKLVNLSLSGYNEDDRPGVVLADQIAQMITDGWTIVASAGNNASCRLAWPAALPDVVAVGAVDNCQPAWFSNHGPWVDASAPGSDVISKFPKLGDGFMVGEDNGQMVMSDTFEEWATWSGTSFSAPLVTARIASAMGPNVGRDAAIAAVLEDEDAHPLPYYGTIVS